MAGRLILVVLGKQGAGKGTQCALLSERHDVPHVSTGDILRAAVKAKSPLGLEVKAVMERGELVSDELIMKLLAERLAQPDACRGALLDGCTRTTGQAEALETMLAPEGVSLALDIEVPTALVVERLSARRTCSNCGAIYSAADEAAVRGVCAKCGGPVVQRADDTPEAIGQRLAAYERETTPVLDFYRDRGLLETVDGDRPVGEVTEAIDRVLAARHLL